LEEGRWVFKEGTPLRKVGMVMIALAVVLVIGAVVTSVAPRGEPGRAVADVARKVLGELSLGELSLGETLLGEAPRYSSSGEELGSAKMSSGEDDSPHYSSGKQSLRHGSSSLSRGQVGQRKAGETARETQAVGAASEAERSNSRSAMSRPTDQRTPSGTPTWPGSQPQQNQPEDQLRPAGERTLSEAPSRAGFQSQRDNAQRGENTLPAGEYDWQWPTPREREAANAPRHYQLLPGAIMGLTIRAIGIYNAPVFDSDSYWALANGVAHTPQTSLPWSDTPQRNVYLSGHRMGFRGTWSRMVFYNLDELREGDKIVLKDRSGRAYRYEVSEIFLAEPTDLWVMGQVRGRDMVTLQTCTPIPTFEKRLIVRADRV
jgi:sortase A